MCACTEPVRTGIGAVCVECGRPKWPITMLNYTHLQRKQEKDTLHASHDPLYRGLFFLGKTRKTRLRAPRFARLIIKVTLRNKPVGGGFWTSEV